MGKSKSYFLILISIIISLGIVVLTGIKNTDNSNPSEVYKVYLDGDFIGAIRSRVALEKYINQEQKDLKKEYDVKKVYIPNGIDIEKVITYKGKVLSEKAIYKKIKQKKSFTIKGYVVNISKEDDKGKVNEMNVYLLNKNIFDEAVQNVLNSFVSEEDVENYKNDTQPEIKTTGSTIENIFIDQDVTIKEAFISTDELIFTNSTDLTKYLLFGTLAAKNF